MVCTVRFFSSKCSLFHNSNVFGSCIVDILYTGCAKIKNNSGAKRLTFLKDVSFEAGSVIVLDLLDIYSREPYGKYIVFFGLVIGRRNERFPGVCARTNGLLRLYDLYLLLCVQCWILDDGQRKCPKHVEFHSKN